MLVPLFFVFSAGATPQQKPAHPESSPCSLRSSLLDGSFPADHRSLLPGRGIFEMLAPAAGRRAGVPPRTPCRDRVEMATDRRADLGDSLSAPRKRLRHLAEALSKTRRPWPCAFPWWHERFPKRGGAEVSRAAGNRSASRADGRSFRRDT
jgi:hypothetical protein